MKMQMIPDFSINFSAVENTVFKGAGGQEKLLSPLFNDPLTRVNHSIYDFIIDGVKVETKRQTGGNWFDYAKFHNLSDEDGKIVMMFINHKKGVIHLMAGIYLKDFIDLACSDPRCQKDGWNKEAIADAHTIKSRYPALEFKAPVNIPRITREYRDKFKIYYEKIDIKRTKKKLELL